ncbi:NAD-P-binding protein [Earliella scabrosa]|nr:NAD-P-binding protein [Earliella scabrosa]
MTTYAIIGASRGIGLEYVRQLASKPAVTVFAVVRNAQTSTHLTSAVSGLANVHVLEADVTHYASLEAAATQLSQITGGTLDCLIHNAARMDSDTFYRGFDSYANIDELDADFITAYKINTLGAVHSIAAFLPLLRASSAPLKKIVVVNTGGALYKANIALGEAGMVAYSVTKAAELMAATKWALKLKDEGFVVISLTPGLVDTSSTSKPEEHTRTLAEHVEILKQRGFPVELETPEQSVFKQLKVVEGLKSSDNTRFFQHNGQEWNL